MSADTSTPSVLKVTQRVQAGNFPSHFTLIVRHVSQACDSSDVEMSFASPR
jgi:hypothetical protein